jgi:LemA protein
MMLALILLLVPLVWLVLQYNSLIGLRNYVSNAWANIDTELKRRYDLIPNLVAVVNGYAAHEHATLERVIALRNRCAANRGPVAAQAADETGLVAALQQLLVVVENYPQLKSDENFRALQTELINTENRIQAARRFYNGNLRDFRNKCESFPSNLVARAFGFQPEEFFSVPPAVKEAPNVQF